MIAVIYPVFAFIAASLLASVLGIAASLVLEDANLTHAAELLDQGGHDWALIRASGSQIELSGTAPDPIARSSAISEMREAFGRYSVLDSTAAGLTAAAPPMLDLPQPKLWLIRSQTDVVLIGVVASENERRVLIDAVDENHPHSKVRDMVRVSSNRFPPGWRRAFEFAARAFLAAGTVSVELTADKVAVSVVAETAEHGRQLRDRLDLLTPANLAVDIAVALSPSPAKPPKRDFAAPAENETDAAPVTVGEFLKISKGANGFLEFAGPLPDETTRRVITLTARVALEGTWAQDNIHIDPASDTVSTATIFTAIEALSLLHSGSTEVRPGHIAVDGVSSRPGTENQIRDLLAEKFGAGTFSLNIDYDSVIAVPPPLMDPRHCLRLLEDTQAQSKVSFEPGSARIRDEAFPIIQQMAVILRNCRHVPMEVSGHTDNQGRESMNLRLSELRARAVLDELLDAGVIARNVTAKGHGEAHPIADNSTEEGREKNRRIEFSLLEELISAPQ